MATIGVKVEGVRSEERVILADTTSRNRKLLFGAIATVVVALVAVFGLMQALKPTPEYGPAGHKFEVDFGGTPSQSSQAIANNQVSSVGGSLSSIQTYTYANTTMSQAVEVGNVTEQIFGNDASPNLESELPHGSLTTIAGLPASTLVTQTGSLTYPVEETVLMINVNAQIQYEIQVQGKTLADIQAFVQSFKLVS